MVTKIILTFSLLIALLASIYYLQHVTPPKIHTPVFAAFDCFERNGLREPWQIGPDGIIVMKGYVKYLVLVRLEAERDGGVVKIGLETDIQEFDAMHHKVDCPVTWQKHTHEYKEELQ